MKPLFIAIEGLDGSGGTTQSKLLQKWLQDKGEQVFLTREPTQRTIGKFIRQALRTDTEEGLLAENVLPFLFAADRQDHLNSEIKPKLKAGSWVVTDRYYHSSLAYQSLSVGLEAVADLNKNFLRPDITFVLWLEPDLSFKRIEQRGAQTERFETLERLKTISKAYEQVIAYSEQRGERILKINADRSIEDIHAELCSTIESLFGDS